ncbi:uncharacterized protein LOC101456887 [Ceratitis capitata]|uniref:(Mediterranean fruit fly) hypothetical protein n=1 Tax=Ceratitis capitata TaxID=7213 RepID=W8CEF5_CERCA|nr:uncharacterized protein LOC101456887 [Ceratitis capitata]CAD7006641.1 unnamed protein product [Ceratitis capitata]
MFKSFVFFVVIVAYSEEIYGKRLIVKRKTTTKSPVEAWTGKWFPGPPHPKDPWKGKWFPYEPYTSMKNLDMSHKQDLKAYEICDDGKQYIGVDYDPNNIQQTFEHLCLANRTLYAPNMNREALRMEYFIPPAYEAPIKCLNETISYDTQLPTFGAYRPIAPKYGSYIFLPAQRWLSSLSQGAIVMLYHPCAYSGQVKLLQNTLRACLYRHVITPWLGLSSERPLALVAWGNSLEMSVVDDHLVVDFIKQNAKQRPDLTTGQRNKTKMYEAGLIQEAHLVTDENDVEICGYKEGM